MLSTGSHLRALQTEGCCQAAAARWLRTTLLLLLLLPLLCPFIVLLEQRVMRFTAMADGHHPTRQELQAFYRWLRVCIKRDQINGQKDCNAWSVYARTS